MKKLEFTEKNLGKGANLLHTLYAEQAANRIALTLLISRYPDVMQTVRQIAQSEEPELMPAMPSRETLQLVQASLLRLATPAQ